MKHLIVLAIDGRLSILLDDISHYLKITEQSQNLILKHARGTSDEKTWSSPHLTSFIE